MHKSRPKLYAQLNLRQTGARRAAEGRYVLTLGLVNVRDNQIRFREVSITAKFQRQS